MVMLMVVAIMMLMAMMVVFVEMMMLLVLVMMLVVKVVVKVVVVVVMMVFVMINAGDQSPQGRFRGIFFDYPKGFLKKSYPLAVDIAHNMLNRLYVRPPPPDADPHLNPVKKLCQPDKQPTGDQRAQVASRG
ncbi:hypothetical protein DPMN_104038 [Dreissena polymorpha]|uniref:Uncharacterized protein n=1 Tax=Dreissena polymorpha TaxID=45954 RepID=A0A9D4H961_DREPO|nr:hypothetical protein DPMN_104038 [Dreissena polymorpha]